MKKHGAAGNRRPDGTGGVNNPWFTNQVKKRRKKNKIAKKSKKANR